MTPVVSQSFQARQIFFVGGIVCIGLLYSCKSKDPVPVSPYANDLGIKPATIAQIDTAHYTTIEWMDRIKDFGTIQYGDSVLLKFGFKNTGVHPLFLSAVRPSCGCTVPHYPIEAIMPGEENELTVNFHSIGQADTVHKTILVTSNTSNGVTHLLTIEGRIDSRRDREGTK
jgi:Protein of unknown function (DUF1573)